MKSQLVSFISSVPFLIFAAISVITIVFFYWLKSDNFRFTVFAYKRPWVFGNDHRGEFQTLTNENRDSPVVDGMVTAESTLCNTFNGVISGSPKAEVNKEQFERAKNYLKITRQNDIQPTSVFAQIGLFVLILAEAVGTGFVLAPWMSTEITPSQANVAAGVLALTVAIILALLTHTTGSEMAQYVRYQRNSGSEGQESSVDVGDDQMQDAFYIDPNTNTIKPNPAPRRFSSRVPDPGAKGPTYLVVSTIIILAIMAAIFTIRMGGIESETTKQVVSMEKNGVSDTGKNSNPFATPKVNELPPDIAAAQQQTRNHVAESLGKSFKTQGMAASMMLALIYLVTQFTAYIIAFKSAFNGQGEAAYNFTQNQPSFDTFKAKFLEPRIKKTESLLSQLRQARKRKNHRIGNEDETFETFLKKKKVIEGKKRDDIVNKSANIISTGKTEDDRMLLWDLEVSNYNYSQEERDKLAASVQNALASRNSIRSPMKEPVVSKSTDLNNPPYSTRQSSQLNATIDNKSSSVVRDSELFDQIAREFLNLNNSTEKVNFLQKQEKALSLENLENLKVEIQRQKKLIKEKNKYGDLLDD